MALETISVSHGKATAYLPVVDLLHVYFRITSDYLADSIGTFRILMLLNYRPCIRIRGVARPTTHSCVSFPLGKESADEMSSSLLGDDESVTPLKRLIATKTEGNPLFMEEIYQALIEEGVLVRDGAVRVIRP